MNTTLPSWSGLSRPSTSSFIAGGVQGVDARHKGEHDGFWNNLVFMGSGLGPEGPPRNDGELGVPPKKKGKADALPLIVRFYRCTGTRLESVRLICEAGVCSSQDLVRSASTGKAPPAPEGLADCDGSVTSLGSFSLEFLQD